MRGRCRRGRRGWSSASAGASCRAAPATCGWAKTAFAESLGRIHETLDARQREQLAEFLGDKRGSGSGPFRT